MKKDDAKIVPGPPSSPIVPGLKNLGIGVLCLVIHLIMSGYFPPSKVYNYNFVTSEAWYYRFFIFTWYAEIACRILKQTFHNSTKCLARIGRNLTQTESRKPGFPFSVTVSSFISLGKLLRGPRSWQGLDSKALMTMPRRSAGRELRILTSLDLNKPPV